jgi:hypothetical protein
MPQNPKWDESGMGRDESGFLGRIGRASWDESAARASCQRAGGGPCRRMNLWVIRRGDALGGPRIDTNNRMPESCSAAGSPPSTSAPMPTPVQHSCRPTSAPLQNRYILFSISFFSSSIYLLGTPRGPIPQPDRSPSSVRDFHLLIPALRGRRLHGRPSG